MEESVEQHPLDRLLEDISKLTFQERYLRW